VVRSFRSEDALSPVLISEVLRDIYLVTRTISLVLRCSGEGSGGDRLGTGLQAMQLSPHHAGLAGLQLQHLRSASRFAAMLLSPSLSASGKAVDL
jgi:hypothetical protein